MVITTGSRGTGHLIVFSRTQVIKNYLAVRPDGLREELLLNYQRQPLSERGNHRSHPLSTLVHDIVPHTIVPRRPIVYPELMRYNCKHEGVYKVILVGSASRDSVLRHTSTGKPVSSIRLATNRQIKGEEEMQLHSIVCWDRLAETTADYVARGYPRAVCDRRSRSGPEVDHLRAGRRGSAGESQRRTVP